jgi:predicted acyltransferase
VEAALADSAETSYSARVASLDAFRGFVLLAMASMGLGLPEVARHFPDNQAWQCVGWQLSHAAWRGCSFWDLIQPAFMFMVGVSMVYSCSLRREAGHSYSRLLSRTLYRSVMLIMLGILIASQGPLRRDIVLTNVLTQIGLGYTFLFFLENCRTRWQVLAAILILAGDWALYYYYPPPPKNFDYSTVGLPADWPLLEGVEAHWQKNANVAADFDRVVLNWLPRRQTFQFSSRGYTTLNFVPSLATMIFGLLTGRLLRSNRPSTEKLAAMASAGAFCLLLGGALDASGYCPMIKRLWTPSFAVYSTGWVLLGFSAFYGVIDLLGCRLAFWPCTVVGMNSMFMYCLSQTIGWPEDPLAEMISKYFGPSVFSMYGAIEAVYAPIVRMLLVLGVLWLVCAWLYRRKIFLKI